MYGFLPFLPSLALILLPLLKIFGFVKMELEDRAPMAFCLLFIISIVHCGGLERWGANFLYILSVLRLFSSKTRSADLLIFLCVRKSRSFLSQGVL